jgi:hypothetical protein
MQKKNEAIFEERIYCPRAKRGTRRYVCRRATIRILCPKSSMSMQRRFVGPVLSAEGFSDEIRRLLTGCLATPFVATSQRDERRC